MTTDKGHDTDDAEVVQMEWKAECTCGQMWGRFDAEDLDPKIEKHKRNCDGEVTVHEREKQGRNYSDAMDLPGVTCSNCGAENVPGQVICAVCGGMVPDV